MPVQLPERLAYARATADAGAALGEESFVAAWAAGQALTEEAAVAVARAFLATVECASTATAMTDPAAVIGLSPRELEVLRLVAEGRSDREIAAALFIGPATVRTHLTSVFGKLDVRSRTAAVAAARRRGIV